MKYSYGGQALIEGVMMNGRENTAIAVRKASGTISVRVEKLNRWGDRYKFLKWPLVRGSVSLIESMIIGFKALTYSANESAEYEEEELSTKDVILSVAIALVLGIGLFFVLPVLLAHLLTPLVSSSFGQNLIEGLIRVAVFLIYVAAISNMKEIARVFQYHGAEHKTIFCYEAGEELTVENVRRQQKYHPRCGTSFMFVLIIIATIVSSIVFSIVEVTNPFLRMLAHLILLPLVVGISYEFNRYAGRSESVISRALRWPGLMIQHLTVFEPDDSMIEVAITAMKEVIPDDGSDEW